MIRARSFLAVFIVSCALLGGLACTGSAGTISKVLAATPAPVAAPKGTGNGLKIAPVRTDITIDKGTSRTVSLFVENITAFPVTVHAVANDFVPSTDESGEPRIILDDSQRAPGNSFKSLIGTLPTVALAPNERREVKVTLTVPTNAAAGGFYGAIRFSPGTGENDKNVALTASVGSIFLVRVPGNITEKLSVDSFTVLPIVSCDVPASSANTPAATGAAAASKACVPKYGKASSLFSSGPVAIETRFRNFGNIHVQPFGKIYIKNFSGKIVETIEINNAQPRGSVLPASIRKFDNSVKQTKFFGKYTAEGNFGYGTNGELLLAKKTFYVIPYKLIGGIIAVILFMVLILPRLIKAYNQRIIRESKQNRRR